MTKRLAELGCYEISLGDTIGTGTPAAVGAMIEAVSGVVEVDRLAAHFHDTYGQALANILAVLQQGVAVIADRGRPTATQDAAVRIHEAGLELRSAHVDGQHGHRSDRCHAHGDQGCDQAIEQGIGAQASTLYLPDCGHAPHQERPEQTLGAMVSHVQGIIEPRQH